MTDQLVPMATIESDGKGTLTLAYDAVEQCIYALDVKGNQVEKLESGRLASQGDASDYICASYRYSWGLEWID